MPYTRVRDGDVHYEVAGRGEAVVLLHGGFCTVDMMRPQSDALAGRFQVFAPERPGHGGTADVVGPLSYAGGVEDTLAFLDVMHVDRAHLVGFSDGANIALLLALGRPDRVRSLVAISGNLTPGGVLSPDAAPAGSEDVLEDDPDWLRLLAAYASASPDGPEHADEVVAKLVRMWTTEPSIDATELAGIACPALVVAGQHDLIQPEHTRLIAESIPDAELMIVPGATHLLLEERPALIALAIGEFLESVRIGRAHG